MIANRRQAGLISIVVTSILGVACLGRQLTFDHLQGADRVEVRTNRGTLLKIIVEPAVITAAQSAVARHDAGWEKPWYGTPVPKVVANFYRGPRLLGGYGVGEDFLTTDPGPGLLSRSITPDEAQRIAALLGVALMQQ